MKTLSTKTIISSATPQTLMAEATHDYPPLTPFEQATGYCPEYVADDLLMTLQHDLQVCLPPAVTAETIDMLSARAQMCYFKNPAYQKRVRSAQGLEYIKMFYFHWLGGYMRKHTLAQSPSIRRYCLQKTFPKHYGSPLFHNKHDLPIY